MKRLLISTVIASSVFAGSAATATATGHDTPPPPTIAGIVASSGTGFDDNRDDYDILLAAVSAAGLVDALNDPAASLTVFAPKDRAFTRLARDLGYTKYDEAGAWEYLVAQLTALGGGDPIPTLKNVLLYHVSVGAKSLSEIKHAKVVDTLLGSSFTISGNRLVDAEPDLKNPRFNDPTDLQASNGVIHTISRVLIPIDLP